MQRLKPLVLTLLTCSLLSCETTKPAPTTSGLGKTSQCGEILVGITTEKRELEVVGATLKDFWLGKFDTRVTPEFQRITSEAAMNEDMKVKLACKAIEMAGVEGNAEMVSYFMQLEGFLSSSPSVTERLEWAQKIPVPKTTTKGTAGSAPAPQEPPFIRLARSCEQPIIGLRRPPVALLRIWLPLVSRLRQERFPPDQDLVNLYNFKSRIRDDVHTPEDFFRESLYTLKCLEDEGELRLEPLGTNRKYEDKEFENQRIVFRGL